jgi:transposase
MLMSPSKRRATKTDKAGPNQAGPALDRRFLDMTPEQVASLLERVDASLPPEDAAAIRGMAATVRCLDEEIKTKGTSIRRLRALAFGACTETTRKLFPDKAKAKEPQPKGEPKPGHGPKGSKAFPMAERVKVPHATLKSGDCCPECPRGRVYPTDRPAVMVRIVGMSPLYAKVIEREVLRCSGCGESFPAAHPEGPGPLKKFDETVPAMAALFRFGTGMPYTRFARFLLNLGIPLPMSTMCDLVMDAADLLDPVLDELMRWAAQGDLIHQDDTVMKILDRPDLRPIGKKKERKGVYTTGLISKLGKNRVALFITGMQHAGENLADLLKLRMADLAKPIQMCDALAANTSQNLDTIVAHCLAHARRKFVEVHDRFPEECRHLLEVLREVYKNDAATKDLSPPERLAFHQEHSGKLMKDLEDWLHSQFRDRLVEPNSGLGKAISYMLNHWQGLTLFLREPGAPLDNNQIERGLKRAIMHRNNSLFYKTQEGARVGDLYMSLIHSAELNGANPFEYLAALLRNHAFVEENPEEWMPWNYQETLAGITA